MVSVIITVTVAIILFVAVLAPVIGDATAEGGPLSGNATWITLVGVVGTLTIISIVMIVVRTLGNKERIPHNRKPKTPGGRPGRIKSGRQKKPLGEGEVRTWKST